MLEHQGAHLRILFLEASTDVLVRRYESSRRRHPLADDRSLAEAIEAERLVLGPAKAEADVVVDTSDLNVHQLRARLLDLFGDTVADAGMQTTITSFGYKHGLPLDTDLVIDCRFLPNPHWVEELRDQTGLDAPVRDYVLGQPVSGQFLDELHVVAHPAAPRLRERGQELPHAGLRVHRRPAPVGRHRRGGRPPPARARPRSEGHPPRHRPLTGCVSRPPRAAG